MTEIILTSTLGLIDTPIVKQLLLEMAAQADVSHQSVRTTIFNEEETVRMQLGASQPETLTYAEPVPRSGGWRHGIGSSGLAFIANLTGLEPVDTYPVLRCQVSNPTLENGFYHLSKGHLRLLWNDALQAKERGVRSPGLLIGNAKDDTVDGLVVEHSKEGVERLAERKDPWFTIQALLQRQVPVKFKRGFRFQLKKTPHNSNDTVLGAYMKALAYHTPTALADFPEKQGEDFLFGKKEYRPESLVNLKDFVKESGLYQARTFSIPR